jgi:hypothetical protein
MIVICVKKSGCIGERNARSDYVMSGLDIERFLDFGERGEGEMQEYGAYKKAGQGAVCVSLVLSSRLDGMSL